MAATRKTEAELKEELKDVAEPVRSELTALRSDLHELGDLVSRIGRDRAAGLRTAASSAAGTGYAKGEAAVEDIVAELRSLEDELAEATRRRPFAAIGLAALVGFLLGVLFRR